ncbi:MAG: carbohydrate-binding family 9-like protein [Chthoniobacterales bacterium]
MNFPITSLFIILLTVPLVSASAQSPPFRQVAFYEAPFVEDQSDNSGRLPEEVWKNIPPAKDFYLYWKSDPPPGEVPTEMQMAYDKEGIYLRVTNHEDHPGQLRTKITKRGNPHLWQDDCIQAYFDPEAAGIGYVAFTMNSLGVQDDRKQLDGAVSLEEWRGDNWRVWTRKEARAWIVEAFFPFADFGKEAREGDLWMFNLVRFAYTSGKFQGVTWSPGGNYASPGNFGYLCFRGKEPASPKTIATTLQKKITPPWIAVIGDKILLNESAGSLKILTPAKVKTRLVNEAEDIFSRLQPMFKNDPNKTESPQKLINRTKQLDLQTANDAQQAILQMTKSSRAVWDIYWNESLRALIENPENP